MPMHITPATVGAILGALTVLSWSAFNVAAKAGIDAGMSPAALSFLRYITPAFVAVSVWIWLYRRSRTGQVPPLRLAALALLGGPVFGLTSVAGYQFAPLSHGLLFAPVAVFLTGTLLGAFLLKEQVTLPRILGACVMFSGLTLLVGESVGEMSLSWPIGIALFVTAGGLWGSYTVLLRLWQVPALEGTAAVASLGAVIASFLLGPLAWESLRETGTSMLMLQILLQGVFGGIVSVLALIAALRYLSTQTAAMLPTFTPAVALLMAWVFVGTRPELVELLGAGIIFAGFALATRPVLSLPTLLKRRLT